MLFNSCDDINRKLSACLDGELSPGDLAAVKAHLADCRICAAQLTRMSDLDAGIRELPAAAPAPFFAAKVTAAARSLNQSRTRFHRLMRFPVPAMAFLTAFILFNIFTFSFNINAMENGPRRELARKVVAQLAQPASIINPVALARLCGECSKYMCLCMHEDGKKSLCPCKDCKMGKERVTGDEKNMKMGEHDHVR